MIFSLALSMVGCAAFRPMAGVPARYLPDEIRGRSREDAQLIDLSLLRTTEPAEHRVDSGDVLAVYIENVLGRREQPPINHAYDDSRPPTLGYPLTVQEDGTLSLPLIPRIVVRGKTIPQIQTEIRYAYTIQRRLLPRGQDRILISLHRPRQHRILVVRQELQSDVLSSVGVSTGNIGTTKKGTGEVVSLPVYKNDVLNALVQSGGLPGLDAQNVVYVIRARKQPKPVARPLNRPPMYPPVPQYPQPMMQQPLVPIPMQGPLPQTGPLPQGYNPLTRQQIQQGPNGRPPAGQVVAPNGTYQQPGRAVQRPSGAAASAAPTGGGIQQMSYWVQATPRQVAEQITGIPMPPPNANPIPSGPTPPMSGYSAMSPVGQPIPGAVSGYPMAQGRISPQAFGAPQMIPGGIPAGGQSWRPPASWSEIDLIARGGLCNSNNVIRIPLRVEPTEMLQITEPDVTLEDGDIVFIGSRDDELFYTGGLLGGGEYTLPKDRDLDILEAIAIADSGGSGNEAGRSALNSDVSISPSQAIILRQMPNDTQLPILVDLYRARKYRAERINIQPGDYIILQYTKTEAFAAFIERHIFESALLGLAAAQFNSN